MLKDVSAGQFDQKFLVQAHKSIKDGEITQKELQLLGEAAAADGEISEDECALIANLDQKSVQGALAQAVEGKGRVFQRYEFNQQVKFSLETSDHHLKIGGQEQHVRESLENRHPGRRLKLVFGRDADAVRDRLAAKAEGRDDKSTFLENVGINNLTRGTEKSASGVGQLIRDALAKGKDERIDLSSIEGLDLNQGLNLSYSLLVARTSQMANCSDKAQSRELRKEIKAFDTVLRQCSKGKAPDADEIALLRKFGLDFKNGQLVNLSTKQAVSADELADLRATSRSICQAFDRVNIIDENKLVKEVFSQIHVSESFLDQLEDARRGYLESETAVRRDEATVQQSTAEVDTQTVEVQRLEAELKQKSAVFEVLGEIFAGRDGTGNFDTLQSRLAQLSPEQLRDVNGLLAKYGLEMRVDSASKSISYLGQGQPIAPADFFRRFRQHVGTMRQELEQARNGLEQAKAELVQRKQKLSADLLKLEASKAKFATAGMMYDGLKGRADAQMAKLMQLYNNPATRSQLPPEVISRIEALQQSYQAATSQYEGDLARRAPLLNSVDQTLSRGRVALEKAEAALESAARSLEQLNQLMDQLDELLGQLEALEASPTELAAAEQIEAANALEGQLNLMPKPMYVGIEKLTEELKALMQASRAQFDQLGKVREAGDRMAMKLSGEHLDKAKKALDYHLAQLKQLDSHNKEQMARVLQDSLAAYKAILA